MSGPEPTGMFEPTLLLLLGKAWKPWKLCLEVGKALDVGSEHTPQQGGKAGRKQGCLVGIWGVFFLFFSSLVFKPGLCSHCCVLRRVWPHNAIKTNHRKERN